MSSSIMSRKLRSSTMIETLVALVLLMIAFSFGMVIFMKVTSTGASDKKMRADNHCELLADSLMQADEKRDIHQVQNGISYKVSFRASEEQPDILVMNILAEDPKGTLITEYVQLIRNYESGTN